MSDRQVLFLAIPAVFTNYIQQIIRKTFSVTYICHNLWSLPQTATPEFTIYKKYTNHNFDEVAYHTHTGSLNINVLGS